MSELDPRLIAYVDGALDAAEAKALEAQLASDEALRAQLARLTSLNARLAALPAPTPSPALRRAVLAAIDAPTGWERLKALFAPRLLVTLSVGAAAMLAVVVTRPAEVPDGARWLDDEAWAIARDFEDADDLELAQVAQLDDLEVVLALDELEENR